MLLPMLLLIQILEIEILTKLKWVAGWKPSIHELEWSRGAHIAEMRWHASRADN